MNPYQIVFENDPLNQSYFGFGGQIQNITLNITQWNQQIQMFHNVAMQFGYICLGLGLIFGIVIGFGIAKWYYGRSK
jgi:hypothetical protein